LDAESTWRAGAKLVVDLGGKLIGISQVSLTDRDSRLLALFIFWQVLELRLLRTLGEPHATETQMLG